MRTSLRSRLRAAAALVLASTVALGGPANAAQGPTVTSVPLQATPYQISLVRAYVSSVYGDLFGRAPDAGGLATWVGKLLSGTPYGEVANAITGSDEYRSRLIRESYTRYLGRSAEPAGLDYWLRRMYVGQHIEDMQAGFIASDEFYARGGGTDAGWVTLLYRTVLGRTPAPSEVAWWAGAIGSGMNRGSVALGFLYSTEHLTTVVDGYYVDLLGRHIDPSGKASWVGLIQHGHRDEEIIAGIVASTEYRSKAQRTYGTRLVGERVAGDSRASVSISADGRWVAYAKHTSLSAPGDASQVYVWDRATGATTLVSASPTAAPGDADSSGPSISADGRWIAYASNATDLVSGDTNGNCDVFLWDRSTGATSIVSRKADGAPVSGCSSQPSISGDGRWIAYTSSSVDLVPGVSGTYVSIFVTDRVTGHTSLASAPADGGEPSGDSQAPVISADGRWVAYESRASNLAQGDTNGDWDVFEWDRATGTISLVSATPSGRSGNAESMAASISADGRWVAYQSYASDLVSNDSNGAWDVFVADRTTGRTALVSIGTDGNAAKGGSTGPSISANGRWVAYGSNAWNLVDLDGNGGVPDVFVTDGATGETSIASIGQGGGYANGLSSGAGISADGQWIAYESDATNLVEGVAVSGVGFYVSPSPISPAG